MPTELTKENFQKFINGKLVLVDFWAPWCGPCRMLSPILDQIEKEMPDVSFGKVNVDEQNELADQYQISGVPTLILFSKGNEVDKRIGFGPKNEIMEWLKEYIES
ncbi:MAG: thioredoxin [Candidatus Anstonellaceae archaeon]